MLRSIASVLCAFRSFFALACFGMKLTYRPESLRGEVQDAYAEALKTFWLMSAGLCGLGVLTAVAMKDIRLKETMHDTGYGPSEREEKDVEECNGEVMRVYKARERGKRGNKWQEKTMRMR